MDKGGLAREGLARGPQAGDDRVVPPIQALILDLGNVLAFHDNARLFAELGRVFEVSEEAMRARLDGGLWDRVNRGQLPGDALRKEFVARLGHHVSPGDTTLSPCS